MRPPLIWSLQGNVQIHKKSVSFDRLCSRDHEQGLAAEKLAYRAAGITVKTDFENSLPPIRIDSFR